MIRGVGIDMVDVDAVADLMERMGDAFVRRTFTPAEVEAARAARDPAEYLSTRFAAKEAVFKAVARFTRCGAFDLRIVETRNESGGAPYIHMGERLRALLQEAGVGALHLSITTEGRFATAMVVAE